MSKKNLSAFRTTLVAVAILVGSLLGMAPVAQAAVHDTTAPMLATTAFSQPACDGVVYSDDINVSTKEPQLICDNGFADLGSACSASGFNQDLVDKVFPTTKATDWKEERETRNVAYLYTGAPTTLFIPFGVLQLSATDYAFSGWTVNVQSGMTYRCLTPAFMGLTYVSPRGTPAPGGPALGTNAAASTPVVPQTTAAAAPVTTTSGTLPSGCMDPRILAAQMGWVAMGWADEQAWGWRVNLLTDSQLPPGYEAISAYATLYDNEVPQLMMHGIYTVYPNYPCKVALGGPRN